METARHYTTLQLHDGRELDVLLGDGDGKTALVAHHGRWLADEIPGCRFELATGHGHFSMGVANRDEILDDLLVAAR